MKNKIKMITKRPTIPKKKLEDITFYLREEKLHLWELKMKDSDKYFKRVENVLKPLGINVLTDERTGEITFVYLSV